MIRMKKTYTDDALREILTASIQNKTVDTRIAETLEQIRQSKSGHRDREKTQNKKRKASYEVSFEKERNSSGRRTYQSKNRPVNRMGKWRKAAYGTGAAAAVILVSLCIFVANPSMAADIPILGNIFLKVQEFFPFGKMPEDETTKLYQEKADQETEGDSVNEGEEVNSVSNGNKEKNADVPTAENAYLYQDSDQGITITFTEYYASNQAVFFGVCIENEEAFPAFATMGDTNYQLIQVNTREEYSFRDAGDTELSNFRNIEGRLTDAHTFVGVMRIDYDSINVDARKYNAAYDEAEAKGEETPTITAETWDQYMELYEVPDNFEMQMKIQRLQGYCKEEIDAENGTRYKVRGEWAFDTVRIQKSNEGAQTIEINEVNEQGIGIERIEISPVELTLHMIQPADYLLYGVVLDKDGRLLTVSSGNAYELAITGHDVSTVTIYVCDYVEYMDEIKGYELESDEKMRSALEEKCLFKKEIDTGR